MDGLIFKTKKISGISGKVTVALNEETGSVYIEQRGLINKKDNPNWILDLKYAKIIRESPKYIVIERAIHFHRESFGAVLWAISEIIERNNLSEKFPEVKIS